MFDGDAAVVLDRIGEAARAEARAAAERLMGIGELYAMRLREHGERHEWAADTSDAVAAEVAAVLRTSVAMGHSNLNYARAMRERLPRVAEVFLAGDIDFRLFRIIVYRTELITDADARAAVDARLAIRARRWPSMTGRKLAAEVDRIVAKADRDAVRRTREDLSDRYLNVVATETGFSWVNGVVLASAGQALDRRLDELAASVCADDPRTVVQRRADALGALASGADRLICGCDRPDCPMASSRGQRSTVLVHVVADQATVAGTGDSPGWIHGEGTVPAEVVRELSKSAKLQPLKTPFGLPAEAGYQPSRALAEFVRARDLTCRAPGCDRPATLCDIDHTVPHGDGGATHASNLKCLCRLHHLLKTFWGWRDTQSVDGTVIWTTPSGRTYVTMPGSALLFPQLSAPTGELPPPAAKVDDRAGERVALMPTRTKSRSQYRAARIRAERAHNARVRDERRRRRDVIFTPSTASAEDDEPPPF